MFLISIINSIFKDDLGNINFLGKLAISIIIFLSAYIITKIVNKVIDKTILNRKSSSTIESANRIITMTQTIKRIIKYVLFFFALIISLDMFGVNTASLIATLGIGGFALTFGAQSLVKDMITGFFILVENQYSVGDYVQIGSKEGIVEELGIRITKIRDFTGELHIIPNGSITEVTNKTRGGMRALVKVGVSYEDDLDHVLSVLNRIADELKNDEKVIEGPTVLGVTQLGSYSIEISIVAKTVPMEQWSIERNLRKRIKEEFEKEGIEIPYQKIVVLGGEKS
ncbi:MAG TPA: mechanosensitive ion channel family protein [Soehngenia sp.]|nr:mechanosensitive ion channel family protein [Soehngenia sp.]HPP31567.1 mechanosensitive ion channel family protein [Soehngenia sp.]